MVYMQWPAHARRGWMDGWMVDAKCVIMNERLVHACFASRIFTLRIYRSMAATQTTTMVPMLLLLPKRSSVG